MDRLRDIFSKSKLPNIDFSLFSQKGFFLSSTGYMLIVVYFLLFLYYFPSVSGVYVKNKQVSFLFHASLLAFLLVSLYAVTIDKMRTLPIAYILLFIYFVSLGIGFVLYIQSYDVNSEILRVLATQKFTQKLVQYYQQKNEERLPISKCLSFHDGSYFSILSDDMTPDCSPSDCRNKSITCSSDGAKIVDFYIASSNQSCMISKLGGNYVSEEVLRAVLVGGARLIDFDIYTKITRKGAFPIVRSTFGNKKSLNYVEIEKCLSVIGEEAFKTSSQSDPLFIHFNLKSYNVEMYDRLAELIVRVFPNEFLMDPKYHYKNSGHDINDTPICEVFNKIIFIVTGKTEFTKLDQLISLHTSHNAQRLKYQEANYPADVEHFVLETKHKLTIVVPNEYSSNTTPDGSWSFGAQCFLMNYPNLENLMTLHDKFFKNSNLVMKRKYLQRNRDEAGKITSVTLPE